MATELHILYTLLSNLSLSLSPSTFISLSSVRSVWPSDRLVSSLPANQTRQKKLLDTTRYLNYKKKHRPQSIYCLVVTVDNFHICHDQDRISGGFLFQHPLPPRCPTGEICMSFFLFRQQQWRCYRNFFLSASVFFFKRQFVCFPSPWYLVFDELHPDFLKLVPHLWMWGPRPQSVFCVHLFCEILKWRWKYTLGSIISQTIIRSDSDFSFSETSS